VIDGCLPECGRAVLVRIGLRVDVHIRLHE
jgi:uncharacterized metal-binding protein